MLSKEEEDFVKYWRENRLKKRKIFRQTLISLPAGIIIVVAIFINFFSGWYKRATMVANANSSVFVVLLIAGILIVAFVAIFSSYHKWDVNETRYKELISQQNSDIQQIN